MKHSSWGRIGFWMLVNSPLKIMEKTSYGIINETLADWLKTPSETLKCFKLNEILVFGAQDR